MFTRDRLELAFLLSRGVEHDRITKTPQLSAHRAAHVDLRGALGSLRRRSASTDRQPC